MKKLFIVIKNFSLISIFILILGSRHLDDCPAQPYIPIWHIVAGCSGILCKIQYNYYLTSNIRETMYIPIWHKVSGFFFMKYVNLIYFPI